MQRRLLIVQRLAASETLWRDGLDSEGVRKSHSTAAVGRRELAWIGVTDVGGVVRASTGNLLLGANVAARPWFGAGLKGPHVGDVHDALLLAKLLPPAADGEPQRFVDFSAPIVVDGEIRGVLALHGSWDWTKTVIESQLPEDAQTMAMGPCSSSSARAGSSTRRTDWTASRLGCVARSRPSRSRNRRRPRCCAGRTGTTT